MDDVLLFGMLIKEVWRIFYDIFDNFCKASGMLANHSKSCIYYEEDGEEMVESIGAIFSIRCAPLEMGFKYLGFHLKPNNYGIKDWTWMIEKAERRKRGWSTKWLSKGGRLTLVEAVLQQIMVFWAHLYVIPSKILKMSVMINFL